MLPRILKNFNLFVNGRGLAGVADEVELPKISIKTDDFRAGGMDSEMEIDMGTEKLGAKFKLCDPDPEVLSLVGLSDGNSARVVAKGSFVRDSDNARVAVVAEMVGRVKSGDLGTWKSGDKAAGDYEMSVNYYKLTVGGREVYEIDIENMVRRINGVDQLAGIRSDIGLA
jgi:P2 family phage contractile tail tube protein